MECGQVKEYLYEYETKRLNDTTFNEVDEHLKACKRCQLEREELQKNLAMLDYSTTPTLSRDFKDRVMDQINHEEGKGKYWKWVLQGTVAASIILVVVTISQFIIPPQVEKTPKGIEIVIEPAEAENPIIVETRDLSKSFEKLADLIKQFNGQIVRKRAIDLRIEVILKIEDNEEALFFQKLRELGKVQRKKNGYKDTEGNIVIMLCLIGI